MSAAEVVEVVPMRSLAEIEASIGPSLSAAHQAALDLYEIKQRGLWDDGHYRSFSDYVLRRWDISASTASRWVHLGAVIAPLALTAGKTAGKKAPRVQIPSSRQVERDRKAAKATPIDAKSRPMTPVAVPRALIVFRYPPPVPVDLAALAADLMAEIEEIAPELVVGPAVTSTLDDQDDEITPAVLLALVLTFDPTDVAAQMTTEATWRQWDAWVTNIEDQMPDEWLTLEDAGDG